MPLGGCGVVHIRRCGRMPQRTVCTLGGISGASRRYYNTFLKNDIFFRTNL